MPSPRPPARSTQRPPLTLSADEMRTLGYQMVDLIVEHLESLDRKPAIHVGRGGDLAARLWEPIPTAPTDPSDVLEVLRTDVFPHMAHVDHPRFFAFIPSPSNFVGVVADALASGFNVFSGTWLASSGPSTVELVTLDWLRQLCGLPTSAGGLFTSGGSVANLTALAVARHHQLGENSNDAVVYASAQTHSSVDRAMRVLGFRPGQLRMIPVDAAYRLDAEYLTAAVHEDRAAGRRPFCVVANAGTTNTGAVDPLAAIAELCTEQGLWFHVDGAYGAAAMVCDEGRRRLAGIERADSLTLDPHKWFFQPFESGCLLVRDRRHLADAFHIRPEYLKDVDRAEAAELNFADHGIQLTRRFRALKLWMTLKVFGLDALREAVEHGFRLARFAEELVETLPCWDVVTPATLGIVSFRHRLEGATEAETNAHNEALVRRIRADGFAMLSSTVLGGRYVVRLCPINPRTTEADIRATLDRLDGFAHDLGARS